MFLFEKGGPNGWTGRISPLMSPFETASVPNPNPTESDRDLSELKRRVRRSLAAEHPFRIAVEALPDFVSREDFLVHLRILLPLARLEGT